MRNLPLQTPNRRGFTIIEVVLVLAIAGLIFLMVFIALPNMQASQRNTQRRNDYNSLSTMITNYATNHNGSFPTSAQFKSTWLNAKGEDPDGTPYAFKDPTGFSFAKGQVGYASNKKCKADGTGLDTGDKKQFIVAGYIEEGAGVPGTYCLTSHY